MTNEEILQSLNEKIAKTSESLMYLNQCKLHFKTFTNMKMTDEQLIERIAEILFKHEEIDAWDVYDSLECVFVDNRPNLKTKYDNMLRDNELKERQAKIDDLKQQILQLDKEMQLIKENY